MGPHAINAVGPGAAIAELVFVYGVAHDLPNDPRAPRYEPAGAPAARRGRAVAHSARLIGRYSVFVAELPSFHGSDAEYLVDTQQRREKL